MVLIDYDALLDGHATAPDGQRRTAETHRGTPLPVETIRRIACDAGIIPIVLGGHGQALDVGRERRLATRAQRMALRAQYPTCCHGPGTRPPVPMSGIPSSGGDDADGESGWRRPANETAPAPHDDPTTPRRRLDPHPQPNGTWHMHPPQKPPP